MVSESIDCRFKVCSQGNAAVERKFKIEVFRIGVDLILKSRYKLCRNSQLFAEYISAIFLPYIDEPRPNEELAVEEAVLLTDNCSIHAQAETLQTLADYRVEAITFPPHIIHIFQCFDLNLFENFKKKMNYKLPLEIDEHTAGSIKRIFHLMKQISMEDNARSTFLQLSLQYHTGATLYLLHFDEGVLRESPEFTSLWESDYPAEKLSYRRRNSPFGWVNRIVRPEWNQ
jgi:hypothetical protein